MKKYNTKKVYSEIGKKFLKGSESNRIAILNILSECLNYYPLPSNTSYLGSNKSIDFSFVRKYEQLPIYPQPTSTVLKGAMKFFQRSILWHAPQALQNITPPPLLESIAISAVANLYNLNLLWDYVSAGVQEAEQQIVRQISRLINWPDNSDGVFTYGGKGCLTYAIRVGLNRCLPEATKVGIAGASPVVITTKCNHYIIESVCAWLGLGKDACIRVNTHKDETIDIDDFEKVISSVLTEKKPIACIVLSGGSTINLNVDNVSNVRKSVETICSRFSLKYKPFIYFDTVVSWPWLFFKEYDFEKDEIGIPEDILRRIKKASNLLRGIKYADAFGIDFHKIGFAPYNNSAFFVKNKSELHSVVSVEPIIQSRGTYGNNFLQHHTIEHSRSAAPVMAAWTILQSMGVRGFQLYLVEMMKAGDVFRKILPQNGFELLNPQSLCYASIYYPIPPRGKDSFNKLYYSNLDDIKYSTQYTYELSRYFSMGGDGTCDSIDVGFLKCLSKSKHGGDMSVLRVFPMSPHMSPKEAGNIARQLCKMKNKFDNKYVYTGADAPEVIHK